MATTTSATRDFTVAFGNWRRTIAAAMNDYLSTKFRGSKFAAVIALAEPVILVLALVALRMLLKQSLNYYGSSMVLFYASGIFPYYLFLFVSVRAGAARINQRARLPGRMQLDYFIAVALVEILIIGSMMILFFAVLWLDGIEQAIPRYFDICLVAVALMIVCGLGVGLINQAISRFFPVWGRIYGILTRGSMFFSGVFVMPDLLTPFIRNIVVWNPLMHGIEWFRLGLYGQYPTFLLDRSYLAYFALIVLFIGIVFERAMIRSEGPAGQ